jgi:D-glycero-alpha-D-manno-heptose-7-phosphate kinase
MIMTRTPFRISFVGGGSDLPDYYQHRAGMVLSASINKYMYILSHPYFEKDELLVKYSQTELVSQVNDLKHPIIKEAFNQFNVIGGLELNSSADIPAGTGLGSSSAFTVALLHNLYIRYNQSINKATLAENACDIEINRLKEPIGKQDQYASAFGGINALTFQTDGSVDVSPVSLPQPILDRLQNNCLMFYTGKKRRASQILNHQKQRMSSTDTLPILHDMVALVPELKQALLSGNLDEFGRLLHVNWQLKKQLSPHISNTDIDELYELALKNGAIGGKLLGAGGGGFLLFYCNDEHQAKLRESLSELTELPFMFEETGTTMIYSNYASQ